MNYFDVTIDEFSPMLDMSVQTKRGKKIKPLIFESKCIDIPLISHIVIYSVAVLPGRKKVQGINGIRLNDQFTVEQFTSTLTPNVEYVLRKFFKKRIPEYDDKSTMINSSDVSKIFEDVIESRSLNALKYIASQYICTVNYRQKMYETYNQESFFTMDSKTLVGVIMYNSKYPELHKYPQVVRLDGYGRIPMIANRDGVDDAIIDRILCGHLIYSNIYADRGWMDKLVSKFDWVRDGGFVIEPTTYALMLRMKKVFESCRLNVITGDDSIGKFEKSTTRSKDSSTTGPRVVTPDGIMRYRYGDIYHTSEVDADTFSSGDVFIDRANYIEEPMWNKLITSMENKPITNLILSCTYSLMDDVTCSLLSTVFQCFGINHAEKKYCDEHTRKEKDVEWSSFNVSLSKMPKVYFNIWKTFNSVGKIIDELVTFIMDLNIKNYVIYVSKCDSNYVDRINRVINKAINARSIKNKVNMQLIMRGFQVKFVKDGASRKRKVEDDVGIFPDINYRVVEAKTLKYSKRQRRKIEVKLGDYSVNLTDDEVSGIAYSFASSIVTSQVHEVSFIMGSHLLEDKDFISRVIKTTKSSIIAVDYKPSAEAVILL